MLHVISLMMLHVISFYQWQSWKVGCHGIPGFFPLILVKQPLLFEKKLGSASCLWQRAQTRQPWTCFAAVFEILSSMDHKKFDTHPFKRYVSKIIDTQECERESLLFQRLGSALGRSCNLHPLRLHCLLEAEDPVAQKGVRCAVRSLAYALANDTKVAMGDGR